MVSLRTCVISRFFPRMRMISLCCSPRIRVIFLGEQDAGKTTLIQNLMEEDAAPVRPTDALCAHHWTPYANWKHGTRTLAQISHPRMHW